MSSFERSFRMSETLDLSKKDIINNSTSINLDMEKILTDYTNNHFPSNDKQALERLLHKINSQLQMEESISMILLAMKSSQSKTLNNQNKPVVTSKYMQQDFNNTIDNSKPIKTKNEISEGVSKSDEFYLTPEMSRKLLDHQFLTRQKMINSQLEKALYEMPLKRLQIQFDNEFIPTAANQDFVALIGFNEVIDVLQDQIKSSSEREDTIGYIAPVLVCNSCGTDASPTWKKHKIDSTNEEIMCSTCSYRILQSKIRKELEEQIRQTKLQFQEQEKHLIRDYNDMLSSPKKLEMFRQEQEKRHRVQRMGSLWTNKANRQPSTPLVSSKPMANKSAVLLAVKTGSDGKNIVPSASTSTIFNKMAPSQSQVPNQSASNGDATYLQFLQAFATQAANFNQNIDQENLQKLEQILSMVQANPIFVNNNLPAIQLISNLVNMSDHSTKTSSSSSAAVAANTNLMNLLSYFVNLIQTQQAQNSM